MKIKVLLLAALVSAATLSAHAGVHFSFWFNLPVPPVPVVTVAAPPPCVVTPPAPVVVAPPVVTVATVCPGPGYVWVPGYWSGRVWVAGCWRAGAVHYAIGHYYGHYDGHDGHYNGWHR
jgi:hypothetical protein